MKISTKGRYGVRILLDLALHDNETPRLIRDISQSQQISEKYISRLIISLRKAHMVRSIRGAKGGFRLAKQPEELTLLDIVEVMEGPISIIDCVRCPEKCQKAEKCATREVWERLNSDIQESMRKITLADIIRNYQKNSDVFDYCI